MGGDKAVEEQIKASSSRSYKEETISFLPLPVLQVTHLNFPLACRIVKPRRQETLLAEPGKTGFG